MTKSMFSWRHAILESSLPSTTRHVLLTLSCHMNDVGGSCFPSISRLAYETGLSRQSIITHIHHAKEKGWIKVGLHGFGGQKWKSHDYTIGWPEGGQLDLPASEKVVNLTAEGGQPNSQKAVKEVDPNSTGNATRNSTERPRSDRGSRLPEDWWPDDQQWQTGMEHLGNEQRVKAEAEKFRDYWIAKPGKDGRKANWTATWRNWLRRSKEYQPAPDKWLYDDNGKPHFGRRIINGRKEKLIGGDWQEVDPDPRMIGGGLG